MFKITGYSNIADNKTLYLRTQKCLPVYDVILDCF